MDRGRLVGHWLSGMRLKYEEELWDMFILKAYGTARDVLWVSG